MDEIESLEGETLDAICYRYYGNSDDLEAVLRENARLADLGVTLPRATKVRMPPKASQSARKLISLWD